MKTLFINPNLRWAALAVLAVLPLLLVLHSVSEGRQEEAAAAALEQRASSDRVHQLEAAVQELQRQLAEEKNLETELMETLQKYKKLVMRRGGGGDAQPRLAVYGKFLDCQDIDRIKVTQQIAKGHSKIVQEGVIGEQHFAVKSTSYEVKNVKDCVEAGTYKKKEDCFILGAYQILKQAMMLKQLQHPNIVQLLGLCVRSENSSPIIHERGVTVVEELGLPVLLHELVEMDFRARIDVCLDLVRLLQYLADTPLGSIAITDWRDEQFVFVNGKLKIADVDGLNSKEPACNKNMKCLIDGNPSGIRCAKNMECPGTNAKTNLLHARTHFLTPLLGKGIPMEALARTSTILSELQEDKLDADDLLERLEALLKFVETYTKPPDPKLAGEEDDYY